MEQRSKMGIDADGRSRAGAGVRAGVGLSTRYEVRCLDRHGRLKWTETFDNLVVNAGLDDNLDKYFKGDGYTAAHYVGLTNGDPTFAAGDTMASHAGWSEVTAYSQSNRPTLTLGSVSGQSVDNAASRAEFSINANGTTVGGLFIVTNNTKGGSTGTLYGGGAFSGGDRTLADGDTLQATVTLSASAA